MNNGRYADTYESIRAENQSMLQLFKDALSDLPPAVAKEHVDNADIYLNAYLLGEKKITFDCGFAYLNRFFVYFLIRKQGWSTPDSFQKMAVSIECFYKCMLDHGEIGAADFIYLKKSIRISLSGISQRLTSFSPSMSRNR